MPIKQNNTFTFPDNLVDKLRLKVEDAHKGFLGTINEGMSSLYCTVGALLNVEAKEEGGHLVEISLKEISDNLLPIFGKYLDTESLYLMKILGEKCSSPKISHALSIINWEYLPHFLNLMEDDEWVYYSELIYTESLTPSALKDKISEKAYEKALKILNADRYVFMFTRTTVLYQSTVELYFGNIYSENFRKLFKPQENDALNLDRISRSNLPSKDSLVKIYEKILELQSEYNYYLNVQFNYLFWNIGEGILSHAKSSNLGIDEIIENCIQKLYIKFPSIFNKEELSHSVELVKQYGMNSRPPMEILETISWPHIKLLLKIDDVEKQKIIAFKLLENGVSVQELELMVQNNSFNFRQQSDSLKDLKGEKTVIVSKTTENNFTVTGRMEETEPIIHPMYDLNRNIFKVPELIIFLTNDIYN